VIRSLPVVHALRRRRARCAHGSEAALRSADTACPGESTMVSFSYRYLCRHSTSCRTPVGLRHHAADATRSAETLHANLRNNLPSRCTVTSYHDALATPASVSPGRRGRLSGAVHRALEGLTRSEFDRVCRRNLNFGAGRRIAADPRRAGTR